MTEDMIYASCEKSFENWNDFSLGQKEQIVAGYKNGLTREQVSTYAKTDLDCGQMREIRWGLQDGLTISQAEDAASHTELDARGHNSEMFRLVLSLLNGTEKEEA